MLNLVILAHGDYSGFVLLAILLIAAIIAVCLLVIVMSFWITAKVGGSKALVWGAVLGVATVYLMPISSMWGATWGFPFAYGNRHTWIERALPETAEAAALACLVNLIIWYRNRVRADQAQQ